MLRRISFWRSVIDGLQVEGVKLPRIWSVLEQLSSGVVTIKGEANMAHMLNSVLYSTADMFPCLPFACAAYNQISPKVPVGTKIGRRTEKGSACRCKYTSLFVVPCLQHVPARSRQWK